MDEVRNQPLNQAHCLARKAADLASKQNLIDAIDLYKQANEYFQVAFEKCSCEPILSRSIDLQMIENDWKIYALTLSSKGGSDSSAGNSPNDDISLLNKDEEEDVVVVESVNDSFLTDSLNPDRTLKVQQMNMWLLLDKPSLKIRARSNSAPLSRNPLRPTTNENKLIGRKLPKTDNIREEEIHEMVKINQKLARDHFSQNYNEN